MAYDATDLWYITPAGDSEWVLPENHKYRLRKSTDGKEIVVETSNNKPVTRITINDVPSANVSSSQMLNSSALQPNINSKKPVPKPSMYYKTFPDTFVIDYILSVASDVDTENALKTFCESNPKSCNLCNSRSKNGETLLFMAVKKNKKNTAKLLLSMIKEPLCIGYESYSNTKAGENVITLLVERNLCGGNADIFSATKSKEIYNIITNIICRNATVKPSTKKTYITFLNDLNSRYNGFPAVTLFTEQKLDACIIKKTAEAKEAAAGGVNYTGASAAVAFGGLMF